MVSVILAVTERTISGRETGWQTERETNLAGRAHASAIIRRLAGSPKLPLALKLCELRLFGKNLISTLLHDDGPKVPWRDSPEQEVKPNAKGQGGRQVKPRRHSARRRLTRARAGFEKAGLSSWRNKKERMK